MSHSKSATSSMAVLIIVAIAMVAGGVVGYGVADLEGSPDLSDFETARDDVEVVGEPALDPGGFSHPMWTLGGVVVMSVMSMVVMMFGPAARRGGSR